MYLTPSENVTHIPV